jgi:hypothetical protein
MRYLCVLLIVVGLPLSAGAQQRRQPPAPPPPPPPVGMGIIGLPLASMGLPPTINQRQWTLPAPSWERPQLPSWERPRPPAWEIGLHPSQPIQPARDRHRPRPRPPVYPVYPIWGMGYSSGVPYMMAPAVEPGAAPPAPAPVSDIGFLRLEVEPAGLLQIYVDGVYVGTPADHRGELELRAGGHRVEIRAPGYEPLTFDVRIEAERGITYRGDLRATGAPPPAAAPIVVPTGSRTLYVIPGCYLGNVLPDKERLPAGCDVSRMKTHAPQ